eukprot:gene45890-57203_t
MTLKITVYSKSACPQCESAKSLLKARSLPYEEIKIDDEADPGLDQGRPAAKKTQELAIQRCRRRPWVKFFMLVLQIASKQFGIQCIGFGTDLHTFSVMFELIAAHHVNHAAGLKGQVSELQV